MKLAAWLTEHRYSQAAFAEMIGSSQPQVGRFAAGTRMPNRETMRRIIEATGGAVSLADFYDVPAQPSEAA